MFPTRLIDLETGHEQQITIYFICTSRLTLNVAGFSCGCVHTYPDDRGCPNPRGEGCILVNLDTVQHNYPCLDCNPPTYIGEGRYIDRGGSGGHGGGHGSGGGGRSGGHKSRSSGGGKSRSGGKKSSRR